MLADILAVANNIEFVADILYPNQDTSSVLNPGPHVLQHGDTAQFAAGILYAASGQYLDRRDYLV